MRMTLFLQSRLLEDTVHCARCQIVAWLPRNRDSTRLSGMLELTVTSPRRCQIPTVLAEQSQYVRYFHGRSRSGSTTTTANDEVERRGASQTPNEADLSQSSTPSRANRRRDP